MSVRLAPSQTGDEAQKLVEEYFKTVKPRYNAELVVTDYNAGSGYNAKELKPETKKLFEENANNFFGKKLMYFGVGGSIPFMPELGTFYPQSEFLVTGVVTPDSNIHAPDENLNLPYCLKLMKCVGTVISLYQ